MTPPPRRPRRATIRDVAERAGVSISTISHVFSGARPISEATRARVRRAAEELGYRPDPRAQSLRTATTGVIGLVLRPRDAIAGSARGTETFERLIGATATHTLESGHALVLVPDLLDPANREVPMDGCIVAHPYGSDEVLTHLLDRGVPVVTVDLDPDRRELPWAVPFDHAGPVRAMLEQMYGRGARTIILLSGTEDNAWNRVSGETYEAWMAERGLPVRHERLYEGEAVAGAHRVINTALDAGTPLDGVITAASTFAMGASKALLDHGLSVPEDVLLAALTDSEYTRNATPPITGLDLRLEAGAREAVALLLAQINGAADPADRMLIDPAVRWRASTGPRPGDTQEGD